MVNDLTCRLQDDFNLANQLGHRRQRAEGNLESLKLRTPSFFGENDYDAYLEWEKRMDLVFNHKYYTEEKKVRKAASTFRGHAITWWEQTATTRRYLGEPQISSWFEMKTVMKKRFVSTFNGRDLHPKLRRVFQKSKSVDGYYQKMETLPVRATQIEQQNRRRSPTWELPETFSKLSYVRCDMSLVKPEEEIQTTKLIQGHKGKSPITPMMTKNVESFRSNDEEPTHEEEEIHIDTKALVVEETTTESRLNAFVSSYPSSGVKEPASPRERGYNLQPQQDVLEGDQSLVLKHIRGSKHQPDFTPTASPSNSPAFKINLMKDLRLVQGLQILVFEPGGTTYGSKKVNNNLITKVAALHSPFIYKELDLRSNPFKGGGNGAILDRLYVINHQLSSEEEYPEELSKVTACLGALNKENGFKLELSNEEASDWARKKRQRQTKPKHSRGRLWTKKKRQRAYGKAHESDGSKEESKAREARPPDGPNEANNLCMDYSPTRSL